MFKMTEENKSAEKKITKEDLGIKVKDN